MVISRGRWFKGGWKRRNETAHKKKMGKKEEQGGGGKDIQHAIW
jgi:hypothetical protein